MTFDGGGVLRSLIDAAPTPLWLIEPDGSVALVNEAAATVLGYSEGRTLLGRCSHEALHPRHADGSPYPREACPIVAASGTVGHSHAEEFIDRRGRPLRVRWRLRQLEDSDHKLLTFTPRQSTGSPGSLVSRLETESGGGFAEIKTYIESHCQDSTLTPDRVAGRAGVSLRTLQAMFAQENTSPAQEIRRARLIRGDQLLRQGLSVAESAYSSGFNDVSTFSRAYRRAYGRSPALTKGQAGLPDLD
ncbi:PAS domain S-box-containing protein [Nesterenkonia sandarakina]|uniref:PAS domain S-box-containing protein n=2 Tax=Nesterenkonia sandarakina TaxID=272918 RepID=A0A2T0YR46_9MICC|nr:PAS domain S-box-containing protein [Nesterenkonia sandarakina]